MQPVKFNNLSFLGTTKVYAMTDSHQETRKTRAFLSKVLQDSRDDKNVLFLNCGDIFKGTYSRDLERDSYIKMKEAKPDLEMVMTLGNNDFGFKKADMDYLVETIGKFSAKGIKTVCANIFDKFGKRPEWLKPYTIVERDGDRTFVTGFCIKNMNNKESGVEIKEQMEVLGEIQEAIKKEKPDNVVVLNHDFMPRSQEIVKDCNKNGTRIDVTIGGHKHEPVEADTDLNIYYPRSFSDSMYRMNMINEDGIHKVDDIEEIDNKGLKIDQTFLQDLEEYERSTGLYDKIAPSILNLERDYSEPSPFGSFVADNMMKASNSDIAFLSTGFIIKTLEYRPNDFITNYMVKKSLFAEVPLKTVALDNAQLKEVFQNALKSKGRGNANPGFLQCSSNIRVAIKDNPDKEEYEVKQIYINGEKILDEDANPLPSTKKFKCAIDPFIANGGQGFSTLKSLEKKDVKIDGKPIEINEVFIDALKRAPNMYERGYVYPKYEIITLDK